MVSQRLCLIVFLLLHATLLLPMPAFSDEEDTLLQGINSVRQGKDLPALTKNDNAECLASEIADKLDNKPCGAMSGASIIGGQGQPQYANYADVAKKCHIDINTAKDGVVLPVCVPGRVSTLVLTNYTQTSFATYLNNSRYTGVGIDKEDDWVVVVLTTNTPGGSFANAASMSSVVSWSDLGRCVVSLMLVWFGF